jgi:hypothetical protein
MPAGAGTRQSAATFREIKAAEVRAMTADPLVDTDFIAHQQTYRGFVKGVTWSALHVVVVLTFLAYFLL